MNSQELCIIEDLHLASLRSVAPFKYEVLDTLCWYISSGRASNALVEAMRKADPLRLLSFLGKNADGVSVPNTIKNLIRYCCRCYGLSKEYKYLDFSNIGDEYLSEN